MQTSEDINQNYSILTGATIFVSLSPWDTQAVGLGHEDPEGIADPEVFSDLIHPLLSDSVIKTYDCPLIELDQYSRNTPFSSSGLQIPEELFRTDLRVKLAEAMDAKWSAKQDDAKALADPAAADATAQDPDKDKPQPPSMSWDGKWYLYICFWWRVVGPERESGGAPI